MKTSRQEKTKSLNLIIKGNSPKMKTECRSNDTTRNHNSLSVMFCLRSAFVYAHVHSAHHVELPQPHPKRIHQKPPLTLQHFVTALSQAAIFVSFPHLLPYQPAKQQRFAELQPSGFLHRTAGRCHGPSPFPRLPRLCARLAQIPPGKNTLRTPRKAVSVPSVPPIRTALGAPPGQTGGRGLQRDAGRPPGAATSDSRAREARGGPRARTGAAPGPTPRAPPSPQPPVPGRSRGEAGELSFLLSFFFLCRLWGNATPRRHGGAEHPLPNTRPQGCPPPPGPVPAARALPAFVPAASRRQARPARCQPPPPRRGPAAPLREPRPRRENPGPAARLPCGSAILLRRARPPPSPPDPAAPAGHRLCAPSRHGTPRPRPSRGTMEAGPLRHGAANYFRVTAPPPSWPRADAARSPLATLRRWRPSGARGTAWRWQREPRPEPPRYLTEGSRRGFASWRAPAAFSLRDRSSPRLAEVRPALFPQHTARAGSAGLCAWVTWGLPAPLGSFLSSVCLRALLLINAGQR